MSNRQLSSSSSDDRNMACKLLSQYLNGKASFKDLKLGINGKGETTATKDLLTNMGELSTKTTEQDQKLMHLVPKGATTNSVSEMEVSINKASS
ncbi:hypothetical protein HAX54_012268, partial [Datura stramonium]|nr:hypothetical protein [Datura stramonium]